MTKNSTPITLGENLVVDNIDINNFTDAFNDSTRNSAQHSSVNKHSSKKSRLEDSLEKLAQLISNITESYTTAIFVADQQNKILHCLAHHSLSRDFSQDIKIPFGMGLVGWTAENKVRVTVCPFENDSSTLLYYPCDQSLKSFIAVPILDKNSNLVGVIACDSKKSYAFAKITEKLLTECATQVQILIELHLDNQKLSEKAPNPNLKSDLEKVFSLLSSAKTEEQLFEYLCNTPQQLISREAFIALITSHEGFGEATFYSNSAESRIEHHLVDLVCKHKKILSSERSVHVLPHDDIKARSFLSVPIHAFDKEAGALNVLSAAFKGFSPSDIEALEKLANFVGRELERLRSKQLASSRQIGPSLLPWKHFFNQANLLIENKQNKYSLLRIQLNNLFSLEQTLGVKNVAEIHEHILRFVQQLAPQPMLASSPYGTSTYLMGEAEQIESVSQRLQNIIARIPFLDTVNFFEPLPENASQLIAENLELRLFPVKSDTKSISDCIKNQINKNGEIENTIIEKKIATMPSVRQEKAEIAKQTLNAKKLQNAFDQRLSNALKMQDEKSKNFNMGTSNNESFDEDEFVLGESTETKEVANARFW